MQTDGRNVSVLWTRLWLCLCLDISRDQQQYVHSAIDHIIGWLDHDPHKCVKYGNCCCCCCCVVEVFVLQCGTIIYIFVMFQMYRHVVSWSFPSLKQQIFFDNYKIFLFDRGIAASISGELSGEEVARVCIETKADIVLVQNEQILKKVIYSL